MIFIFSFFFKSTYRPQIFGWVARETTNQFGMALLLSTNEQYFKHAMDQALVCKIELVHYIDTYQVYMLQERNCTIITR